MNALALSTTSSRPRTDETEQFLRTRLGWMGTLFFSALFGSLCAVLGWVFSLEAAFGIAGHSWSSIGAILIALFFPLIFLAAHSMDRAQAATISIRLERYRKYGLVDESEITFKAAN